jgi:hypothetical protein
MRYTALTAIALAVLAAASADAQVRRNGIWQGSDAQVGNPHQLAPQVLHRQPAACVVQPWHPPRGVYEDPSWPADTIPYVFSANTDGSMRQAMRSAMDEIVRRTRVKFIERSDEDDYIFIQNSDVNSSFVGRIGGGQTVNIYNWNFEFIMVHELMHAIGIWHEQSAVDRDNFVTILSQNIIPEAIHNFSIRPDANLTEFYDYTSVMHYGQYAFSIDRDNLRTIVTTDPGFQDVIGQREYLSDGDVEALQDMHGGPITTEWVSDVNPFFPFVTGTFTSPHLSFNLAVSEVPNGGRIISAREHTTVLTSTPLTINKNIVIDGAPVTIR